MKEKILEVLKEKFPGIDFTVSSTLIDDDVIDSFKIIQVVSVLSDNFNIDIPYEEISGDNFNSIDKITEMVEKSLKNGGV